MSKKYEKKVTKRVMIYKLIQTRLSIRIQIHDIDLQKHLINLKIERGKHKINTNSDMIS